MELYLVPTFATWASLATATVSAQGLSDLSFRKLHLSPEFYSEGIQAGDLNRDGKSDIISGPFWYPGPTFDRRIPFRTPRSTPFPILGDSDCYAIFVHDFNGDGWPDILSLRLPGGAQAVWYENPKGAEVTWTEHAAYTGVQNESATLLDMDGDGKPEIITNSNGFGGWVSPDWSNPSKPWAFKAVTGKEAWGAFTHGIGAGDLNGDGRLDLIFPTGWWEQPVRAADTPWVKHAASFGGQSLPTEGFGGAQILPYDVDGDGDQDVVTAQQAHGWGLAWYENKARGTEWAPHLLMGTKADAGAYGAAFAQLHALAMADLDGDGLLDIVTGKRKGAHGNGLGAEIDAPAVLYAFRLTRSAGQAPKYQPLLLDSNAGIGTQVSVKDVNGDGSPDILTARRAGDFAFLNQKAFTGIRPLPRRRTLSKVLLGLGAHDAAGRKSGIPWSCTRLLLQTEDAENRDPRP